MPDQTDATEPPVRTVVEVPAELQPRCRARSPEEPSLVCGRPAGHDGWHESAGGERWPEPAPVPTGPDSEDIVLRYTFLAQVLPDDARALERTAVRMEESARESHDHSVDFPTAIEAASKDLLAVAEYLDHYGDNRGDELRREEIPIAAAALKVVPVVRRCAALLRGEIAAARGRRSVGNAEASDLPADPAPAEPERDRISEPDLPALREIYARQIQPELRENLETMLRSCLRVIREAPAITRELAGGIDADLAAAAADLRHVERYLRITGASEGNVLERWESRLADVAAQLAIPVGELARQLEEAVAKEVKE